MDILTIVLLCLVVVLVAGLAVLLMRQDSGRRAEFERLTLGQSGRRFERDVQPKCHGGRVLLRGHL